MFKCPKIYWFQKIILIKRVLQEGQNHLLYVYNFYMSPEFLIDLLEIGLCCTGIIHTNCKHFPKELLITSQSINTKGNFRFATYEKFSLTAGWWKDRRDIFIMSSFRKQATEMVLKWPKGSKDKKNIPYPSGL